MAAKEIEKKEKQQVEGQEQTRPGRYFVPDVDIAEFDHGLKLWVDVPGVTENGVDVSLKDGILTIAGRLATNLYQGLSPVYTEYNVGNYFREFAISENIDETKISARLGNGVLEIDLPKKEQARPRKIEVTSA